MKILLANKLETKFKLFYIRKTGFELCIKKIALFQ